MNPQQTRDFIKFISQHNIITKEHIEFVDESHKQILCKAYTSIVKEVNNRFSSEKKESENKSLFSKDVIDYFYNKAIERYNLKPIKN